MEELPLKTKLEALLFAAGEPVAVDKLAKFLKVEEEEITREIEGLMAFYQEHRSGLQVVVKGNEVQLVSRKETGELVAKFLDKELSEELSTAAAEVLAVVAYRGPLTRAQIEQIRGVNCSFTLRNLAMRGLVERQENPADSRSYLYAISFEFLKQMGISKVDELPDFEELHNAKIITEQATQETAPEKPAGSASPDGQPGEMTV